MSISTSLFRSSEIQLTAIDHDKDPAIEAVWTTDPGFARMVSTEPMKPISADQVKKKYEKIEKRFEEEKDLYYFQVRLNRDNRLIGFGLIENISWTNRTADLILGIGAAGDRRSGYGTKILEMLVQFSFQELNLRKLSATIPSYNPAAIALIQKAGFVQEACRREALQKDGTYWDELIFGLEKGR